MKRVGVCHRGLCPEHTSEPPGNSDPDTPAAWLQTGDPAPSPWNHPVPAPLQAPAPGGSALVVGSQRHLHVPRSTTGQRGRDQGDASLPPLSPACVPTWGSRWERQKVKARGRERRAEGDRHCLLTPLQGAPITDCLSGREEVPGPRIFQEMQLDLLTP